MRAYELSRLLRFTPRKATVGQDDLEISGAWQNGDRACFTSRFSGVRFPQCPPISRQHEHQVLHA